MNTEGVKFDNLRLIIGVVESNADPEKLQRLKVSVPGMFTKDTMDIEAFPWVYPFNSYGYQSYSSILPGTKVLIIYDITNYYSLWYLPYFCPSETTKGHINGETDILMCRNFGHGEGTIYQNTTEGLVIKFGDATINIDGENNINIFSGGKEFKISGGTCFCGEKDGTYEPMVMGQQLYKVLGKLAADLDFIGTAAQGSPYTMHLVPKITGAGSAADNLKQGIKDILSDSVKVSK